MTKINDPFERGSGEHQSIKSVENPADRKVGQTGIKSIDNPADRTNVDTIVIERAPAK